MKCLWETVMYLSSRGSLVILHGESVAINRNTFRLNSMGRGAPRADT